MIVNADNGPWAARAVEEFLHPTPVGEDTFVRSSGGYAANVEAFTTAIPEAKPFDAEAAPVIFDSPDTPTIETLVAHSNAHLDGDYTAADTLKNVVLALTHLDGTRELVVVGIPGDREVDEKRAEVAFAPAEVETATEDDFENNPLLVKGYIGPWSPTGAVLGEESATGIRYLVDPRVSEGTSWITGANIDQKHAHSVVAGRDFFADGIVEIANVRAGDPAPDGSGPVELARGMEIGHVFQLGRKYAEALGLKVLNENGKLVTVTMGSYGIGVTRILAIIAELNNDDKGLIWPASVAPFDVQVVAAGRDQVAFDVAEAFSAQLEAAGLDVLYDDRPKVSPGVKFGDAELVGVPKIVIVGRGAAEGQVELWDRSTGERTVSVARGRGPTHRELTWPRAGIACRGSASRRRAPASCRAGRRPRRLPRHHRQGGWLRPGATSDQAPSTPLRSERCRLSARYDVGRERLPTPLPSERRRLVVEAALKHRHPALGLDEVAAAGRRYPLDDAAAAGNLPHRPPAAVLDVMVTGAQWRQVLQRRLAAVDPGLGVVDLAA